MIDMTRQSRFPEVLTSYDAWKSLALLLMIIDHAGFLLFPDADWMRAIGRLCVPIWFFLIGYARTRDVPMLWIMAAILVDLPDPLIGLTILPLNILFTLLFIRLSLDPLVRIMRARPHYFWMIVVLLVVLAPVTNMLFEYGTYAFLLAILGLSVRKPRLFKGLLRATRADRFFWPVVGVGFFIWQSLLFGFHWPLMLVFGVGMVAVLRGLSRFEPFTYAYDTRQWQVTLMMLCGRYSLEIYVLHLVIFKLLFALKIFL